MWRGQKEKRPNKWSEMPRTRQEQYNVLFRRAREIGANSLEQIISDLFPYAIAKSSYYVLNNMHTGGEGSMWIYRRGARRGCFVDAGSPATDRQKGDIIHLVAEKEFNGNTLEAVEYILGAYGR